VCVCVCALYNSPVYRVFLNVRFDLSFVIVRSSAEDLLTTSTRQSNCLLPRPEGPRHSDEQLPPHVGDGESRHDDIWKTRRQLLRTSSPDDVNVKGMLLEIRRSRRYARSRRRRIALRHSPAITWLYNGYTVSSAPCNRFNRLKNASVPSASERPTGVGDG